MDIKDLKRLNPKDLKRSVEEECKKGNLEFVSMIVTYRSLDTEIGKIKPFKSADDYEFLIMIPECDADTGERLSKILNVYGKPRKSIS